MTRFTRMAAAASIATLVVAPNAIAQTGMTPGGTDARQPGAATTTGRSTTTRGTAMRNGAMRGGAMGGGTMSGSGNPAHRGGGNGPGGRY